MNMRLATTSRLGGMFFKHIIRDCKTQSDALAGWAYTNRCNRLVSHAHEIPASWQPPVYLCVHCDGGRHAVVGVQIDGLASSAIDHRPTAASSFHSLLSCARYVPGAIASDGA